MLRLSTTKASEAFECLKKYDYHENLKLIPKPKNVKRAMRKGIWIHSCLEVKSKGGNWQGRLFDLADWALEHGIDEDTVNTLGAEVRAVMSGHDEYWDRYPGLAITPTLTEQELTLDVPALDLQLSATLDVLGEYRGGIAVVEYKSTSHIPSPSWRAIDPQTAIQFLAARQHGYQPDRIVFDYLVTSKAPVPEVLKSGRFSKRKITTTTTAFQEGVKQLDLDSFEGDQSKLDDYVEGQHALMVSDEKFYQRYEVQRPTAYLQQTAQDIKSLVGLIRQCQDTGHWPRSAHPVKCRMCNYNELCALEYMNGKPSIMREEEFMPDDGSREGRLDPMNNLFTREDEEGW